MLFFVTDKCYKDADHYWPLDKVVAGTVFDLIGSKHGKVNVAEIRDGRGDQGLATRALVLNSAASKTVDFGDFSDDCVGDAAKCANGITVGFWVMVASGKDSDILHTALTTTDRGMTIYYKSSTSLLIVRMYSTYEYGTVSVKISPNTWYHVFVSWKRGEIPLLVINGVEWFVGSRASTTRLHETYTHLLAGLRPDGGGSDGAGLSQVVIWKRALDRKEMIAAFNCVGLQPGRYLY